MHLPTSEDRLEPCEKAPVAENRSALTVICRARAACHSIHVNLHVRRETREHIHGLRLQLPEASRYRAPNRVKGGRPLNVCSGDVQRVMPSLANLYADLTKQRFAGDAVGSSKPKDYPATSACGENTVNDVLKRTGALCIRL